MKSCAKVCTSSWGQWIQTYGGNLVGLWQRGNYEAVGILANSNPCPCPKIHLLLASFLSKWRLDSWSWHFWLKESLSATCNVYGHWTTKIFTFLGFPSEEIHCWSLQPFKFFTDSGKSHHGCRHSQWKSMKFRQFPASYVRFLAKTCFGTWWYLQISFHYKGV